MNGDPIANELRQNRAHLAILRARRLTDRVLAHSAEGGLRERSRRHTERTLRVGRRRGARKGREPDDITLDYNRVTGDGLGGGRGHLNDLLRSLRASRSREPPAQRLEHKTAIKRSLLMVLIHEATSLHGQIDERRALGPRDALYTHE